MLQRRTVLYSHSKRNRYPTKIHSLSIHAALVGLATVHFQQICRFSLFRLVWLFLPTRISVNFPSHTHETNTIQTNTDNFNICNVKRNLTFIKTKITKHPRWAMGKGSGGGAAGLWGGQRRWCRFVDQLGKGRRRSARGRRRRRDGSEIKRVLQSVAL